MPTDHRGMLGPGRGRPPPRPSAEMCLISTDIIWRTQTALPFSGYAGEEELEVFSSRAGFGRRELELEQGERENNVLHGAQ